MEDSKQLFLIKHLQKQQQQQQQNAVMSMFPMSFDVDLRPQGFPHNRPVNTTPNPNANPNLIQQTINIQQQQQNVTSPQMMMMMMQQNVVSPQMMMMQQQQKNSIRSSDLVEMQFAYQDAWRICHPDFKRPFTSLEDAC